VGVLAILLCKPDLFVFPIVRDHLVRTLSYPPIMKFFFVLLAWVIGIAIVLLLANLLTKRVTGTITKVDTDIKFKKYRINVVYIDSKGMERKTVVRKKIGVVSSKAMKYKVGDKIDFRVPNAKA